MTRWTDKTLTFLLLVAGFLVWSSAFILLYAVLSVGCAAGWERTALGGTSLLRVILLLVWIAHLGALAGLVVFASRRRPAPTADARTADFARRAAVGTSIVALVATIWTGLPVVATTMCDPYQTNGRAPARD